MGISTAEMIPPKAVPVIGIPLVNNRGGKIVPKILKNNPH